MMEYRIELPVMAGKDYDIREYESLQMAIDAAHEAGGGRVVVPAGIWTSAPIQLKSYVNLHVESGAVLLFPKKKEDYPLIMTDYEGQPRIRTVSPISAFEAEDIAITGEGVIDGNGEAWRPVKAFKVTEKQWKAMLRKNACVVPTSEGGIWFPSQSAYDGCLKGEPDLEGMNWKWTDEELEKMLEEASPYYDWYRPVMTDLVHCKRVLIENITLQNSANWNLHPIFCEHLTVRNAFIKNPYYAQNGDGIDVESCQYVEIDHTKFDVGDDAICIKSGKNAVARRVPGATEHVYIHDCMVLHGHGGFVVGSEMSRGAKDITVRNCTFLGTDTGIRFKSQLGRGGIVEDITIENIAMLDIDKEAVIFTMGYSLYKMEHEKKEEDVLADEADIPVFRNITLKNIDCTGSETAVKMDGLDLQQPTIHDIHFENVTIHSEKGMEIVKAKNIFMKNTAIYTTGKEAYIAENTVINR